MKGPVMSSVSTPQTTDARGGDAQRRGDASATPPPSRRYRPKSQPLVEAIQWTGDWPAVSLWAYGEVVEASEDEYDSGDYWVLPADGVGRHLSVLIDGNECYVENDEWVVKDEFGAVAVWSDDAFTAVYEEA